MIPFLIAISLFTIAFVGLAATYDNETTPKHPRPTQHQRQQLEAP